MGDLQLPHQHGEHFMGADFGRQLQNTLDFEIVANLFKCLDDPSRVRIFWLLCHCEECVVNISAMVEMTSPAVSHHLRQLKASGLITGKREGKEVYYKASDTEQSRLLHETIEETMEVCCPKTKPDPTPCGTDPLPAPAYVQAQADTIRALHGYVLEHLDQRMTIETLSKRFLMNPTTLKAVFKEVYGMSVASHIKIHRMERAAELLRESSESVLAISKAVGFSSQSRFSTAFREAYQMLPLEFRKLHGKSKR